jgi:beta-alanine degradation protein BauB
MSDDREFGDVGTRFLFENDRVRVWKMDLAPGEYSPLHRHELDMVLIHISGDRIAVCPEPDTQSPYDTYMESDIFPGLTVFIPRGGVERALNVGSEPYREIIVELKD